jgi:hypothetical protein
MKLDRLKFVTLVLLTIFLLSKTTMTLATTTDSLLSEPFLQLPTLNSVNVVWFSQFAGDNHLVLYGENLEHRAKARTRQLSLMREDSDSHLDRVYSRPTLRNIWRHEATIVDISNKRIPYRVISDRDGKEITSKIYSLSALPPSGTPLKILLTSDHQLMPMTAANLQKVVETIGKVDGVFFAGDLVNVPDRASEWFDDNRGGAFFPCLQGRANYELNRKIYQGGEIIQHAPLFSTIGNHEVMGRFSATKSLKDQFNDPIPRHIAAKLNFDSDSLVTTATIKANSFNTDSYEEIFSLPKSNTGGKKYYAVTFGDIRLVVLYVTNVWRSPNLDRNIQGRYQESAKDLTQPENWGYGQHIFESIDRDSEQYRWLETELASPEFRQAKYKIVMFHHPPHTLGGNIVPAYSDPQPQVQKSADGKITAVTYEYPLKEDYIIRDLIPLLETAKVQLVYYGHSHLWNRFLSPSGINFLESSNVGNSYGAHLQDNPRPIPRQGDRNYVALGDPNGLEPIIPNIAPLKDRTGKPLPYIASNEITVFSILDTQTGTISSYRYNIKHPDESVIKFDEFAI